MMELEEKPRKRERTIKDYVEDGTDIVKSILEAVEEGIGVAASPATFWLIFLKNTYSGNGFSGFVSNPQISNYLNLQQQAAQAGISPPPANPPPPITSGGVTGDSILVGIYKGWNIYQNTNGHFQGILPSAPQAPTPEESTIQAVKDDIG